MGAHSGWRLLFNPNPFNQAILKPVLTLLVNPLCVHPYGHMITVSVLLAKTYAMCQL